MAFIEDHKAKFENLTLSLKLQNRNQLKREANGGNSILFAYPPEEEDLYFKKAKELFSEDQFKYIDLSRLLVRFIDLLSLKRIERKLKIYVSTPHKVFTSGDESFLNMIINEITDADARGLTPVLIRTGVLYGTGVENVNIMEHKTVMALSHPLIIFYPAKYENDNLYFLNFKPASKYRCTVIE